MSADTQASHSELPWENGRQFPVVFDADGREILSCHDHLREREAEAEANAAFIVRAVNAFYPLVEVLQEANAAINAAFAQADAEARDHDKAADRHDRIVRAFREKVRAALKLTEASDA